MTFKQFLDVAKKMQPSSTEPLKERESRFWSELYERSRGKQSRVLYCISSQTNFADDSLGWNLAKITVDQSLIHGLPKTEETWFDGIQTPFVYFGMFGSSFSWHREDRNLLSINYLHQGEPKVWYCVPYKYVARFEAIIQDEINKIDPKIRTKMKLNCDAIYRHKIVHAPPSILRKHKIPFGKVYQNEGEFIVTSAGAMHSGANMGTNIAEAVNIALESSFFRMYDDFKYGQSCR